MKLSVKCIAIGVVLLMIGILFFTSIGATARKYIGVFKSEIAVAMKSNTELPSKTYEWRLTNSDGQHLQFDRYKGQVVFLNFWATWCKPCIKELPSIQELYEAYGEKVVFMLVTQEDSSKVNSFMEKRDFDLPIYYTSAPIPDAVFSKTVPTTYIIDKKGQIVLAEAGSSDWNGQETRLLLESLIAK